MMTTISMENINHPSSLELLSCNKINGPNGGVRIANIWQFSVLCVFALFVFVLCLVPNVACVSRLPILVCPFDFLSLYL